MKKYTFRFNLFDKNIVFSCEARNRDHADQQFDAMIKRKTSMHHVLEEPCEPKEPKKPNRDTNLDDIFGKFSDIFGKGSPFGTNNPFK